MFPVARDEMPLAQLVSIVKRQHAAAQPVLIVVDDIQKDAAEHEFT